MREQVGGDVGEDLALGKRRHHDLARSRTVATGKIRERTGFAFNLAKVCPFESAMKRWHTCRRGGGSDDRRRRARWRLSGLARQSVLNRNREEADERYLEVRASERAVAPWSTQA